MFLSNRRSQHFVAMVLIGDGIMALVHPQRDARAWRTGPAPWRALMDALQEHPILTRTIGAVQVAGGIWWALHQEND